MNRKNIAIVSSFVSVKPIEDFLRNTINVRTYNCIKANRVNSMIEFLVYPTEELLEIRNFKEKSLNHAMNALEKLGLERVLKSKIEAKWQKFANSPVVEFLPKGMAEDIQAVPCSLTKVKVGYINQWTMDDGSRKLIGDEIFASKRVRLKLSKIKEKHFIYERAFKLPAVEQAMIITVQKVIFKHHFK